MDIKAGYMDIEDVHCGLIIRVDIASGNGSPLADPPFLEAMMTF